MSLISVTLPNSEDLIWYAGKTKAMPMLMNVGGGDDDGVDGEHFGRKRKESTVL